MIMTIISICAKVFIGLLVLIGAYTLTVVVVMHFGKIKASVTFYEGKKSYDYLIGRTINIKF